MDDATTGVTASHSSCGYTFGRCTLDLTREALLRDRRVVHLRPKSFAVLRYLVEHHDQLVTKEELLGAVWADAFVTEGSLTQCVIDIRRALDDCRDRLCTVPRRGFRFEGPVTAFERNALLSTNGDGTAIGAGATPRSQEWADRVVIEEAAPTLVATAPRGATPHRLAHVAGLGVVVIAAATLAIGVLRPVEDSAAETDASTSHPTRVTFGAGLQTDAAWAPDGKRIAFAADHNDNFDLFIQSLDGSEPISLASSPANEVQPAWSPDGRRLVFRSDEDGGGLFTIDASGGPIRRIATGGFRPVWMPNGRDVAFSDADSEFARLFLVRADGGEAPREILGAALRGGSWGSFTVDQDGRIGVFGVHPRDRFGFYVSDRDHRVLSAASRGTPLPESWYVSHARAYWSGSGDAVFVEAIGDGTPALWRVAVDPATQAWTYPVRLATGPGMVERSAVSPDGRRVAFTSTQTTVRAWVFPFDADRRTPPATGRPVTDEDSLVGGLNFTANGEDLIYSEVRTGRRTARIVRTNVASAKNAVLVDDVFVGPASAARGSGVAYSLLRVLTQGRQRDTEYALAWRDASGRERLLSPWDGSVIVPTDVRGDEQAVLGTYVSPAFSGPGRVVEWPIAASPATAPTRVVLRDEQRSFWQAHYSPNGRWISFVAVDLDDSDRLEMGIVAAEGRRTGTWTRIAADHVWPDKPRWAPDGRTLYFLSRAPSGFLELWGVPIDPDHGTQAGAPFRMAAFDSARWHIDPDLASCEMSVAAGRLVLPMRTVKGSIWVLPDVGGSDHHAPTGR